MVNMPQHAMSKMKSKLRRVKRTKPAFWLACSFWSTFLFPSMHFSLQIMHNDGRWEGACPNRTVSHQNLSIFHIVKQFPLLFMICTSAGKNCGRITFRVAPDRAMIWHLIYGKLIKYSTLLKVSLRVRRGAFYFIIIELILKYFNAIV